MSSAFISEGKKRVEMEVWVKGKQAGKVERKERRGEERKETCRKVKEKSYEGKKGGNFTERYEEWQKKRETYVRSKKIWTERK
jgi:hypothetical protein